MNMNIIRFDKNEFQFDEKEFELSPPSIWDQVTYKPITSKILYKGGSLIVRFPIHHGYGLNEIKSKEKPSDDKDFSSTYLAKKETEGEKRFSKFVNDLEDWCKKKVVTIAKTQQELKKNKKPTVFSDKLSKELIENSHAVKPFFCYPRNPDTREYDETKALRHYIKFKSNKGVPKCEVFSFNNKKLKPTDILCTDTEKKEGNYLILVKIKGVFFKLDEQHSAIIQTIGEVVFYEKSLGYDSLDVLGTDYKQSDEDVVECDEDNDYETKMLKKMTL